MTSKLTATIPTFPRPDEPGTRVTLLFGLAGAPVADNDGSTWRGKFDLQAPYASARRLVNGNKSSGDPQAFHVMAWENPSKPGQFSVGMLLQTWPFGSQLTGTPSSAALWLHSNHDTQDAATKAANKLAQDNTFGTLKDKIDKGGDQYTVLSRLLHDMPFSRPTHWVGWARSAYLPRAK